MDGHPFMGLARNNPLIKQKPIIIPSASFHTVLVQELEKEPLVWSLHKPSTPAGIREAVRPLLSTPTTTGTA